MFEPTFYYSVVGTMIALAVVVFFALQRVTAGYGMMYTKKWGPVIGNRLGWMVVSALPHLSLPDKRKRSHACGNNNHGYSV